MRARTALLLVFLYASQAAAQSGLRLPSHDEPGLDPTFARGWLAPDYDRFGTALHNWREAVGFAPGQRMQWSYTLNDRGSLGMAMANSRELEDQRQLSLYGRYSLNPDWALGVETLSRDATGLFLLRDFRIGVQRRF
ncbi:MAG: hypothetical protein ACREUE_16150 [Panacagrimonas sp.]